MIIKERINIEELLKSLQELLAIESVARRDQEKLFGNGAPRSGALRVHPCAHPPRKKRLSGQKRSRHAKPSGGLSAGDGRPFRPLAIGGGTYAKAMENIVAFGPVFPGEESREHQADEYIALDNIERLRRIYAQAFQNLLALYYKDLSSIITAIL